MFDTICSLLPVDADYPPRTRALEILKRVLEGTLYDILPYQFHEERSLGGEYIPLRKRRPGIRYNLCRTVVEDSVSLLFSEGHFPTITSTDLSLQTVLSDLFKECRINQIMTDAAIRGSVGSIAIMMRVLRGRVFFEVIDTIFLTPTWDPSNPDSLLRVVERYKVSGQRLIEDGYTIPQPNVDYWFQRQWDSDHEAWFLPTPIDQSEPPLPDIERSVRHGLAFVPIVWIKNLPGNSSTGDRSDGACTFRSAIETQIEIEYQLSQAGRGLKYSSDPTLLIKEPVTSDNQIVKGAGNALVVSEKGDARLLEIGGTASAAVIEYVRMLRELALESVHGNRASADRLSAAQSGRALELMNQGLLWLADNLRVNYGEVGLIALVRMVVAASQVYPLRVMGKGIPPLDQTACLSISWRRWYPPTADDRQKDAQTIAALNAAGLISRETAIKVISLTFDIEDIEAEILAPDSRDS
jgi:hypothetical protein